MNNYFITDLSGLSELANWLINNVIDFGLVILLVFNLMASIFLYLRVKDIQRSLTLGKDSLLAMLMAGNIIVSLLALVLILLLAVVS